MSADQISMCVALAKNIFTRFHVDMKVQNISQNTFKGYDARPLKGFLMSCNCYGIADEMYKIGQKEGFKIYSPFGGFLKNKCDVTVPSYSESGSLWAQDYWTVVKDKLLTLKPDEKAQSILKFFNLKFDFTQKCTRETPDYKEINKDLFSLFAEVARTNPDNVREVFIEKKDKLEELYHKAHISGGNIFIVKDGKKDCVFVGKNELKKYDDVDIQAMYCAEDVIVLPQMDYHLDLFIRPLDKKRVLLADDKMAYNILCNGLNKLIDSIDPTSEDYEKIDKAYHTMLDAIKNFRTSILENKYPQTDEIEEILEDNGFDVIRVPGRIYEKEKNNFLKQYCNFINANAFLNDHKELVYITNKSDINEHLGLTPELSEKIGFDFEQEFVKSISKYVKPEHVYFVDGDKHFISRIMLTGYQGGIHCACSEIPL